MSYELLYVIEESVEEKEIPKITKQIEEIIKKRQGTLQKVEILGRKKLAYQIKKNIFGTFVVTLFTVGPENTRKIIRDVNGVDGLIRFMITKSSDIAAKKIEKKAEKVVKKSVKVAAKKPILKVGEKSRRPSGVGIPTGTSGPVKAEIKPKAEATKPFKPVIKPAPKPKQDLTQQMESESERLKKLDEKLDELLKE